MLSEKIKIKIIEYLTNYTNSEDWDVIGKMIESTDCNVYRFSSPYFPKDIAVKLYHLDKGKKKSKHYSAIERYSKALNIPGSKYRVPEPYGLFQEDDLFLMEWIEGETLKDKLWHYCFNKKMLQLYIKNAYCWLSCFHQHANSTLKIVDVSVYLKKLELHNKVSNSKDMTLSNSIFLSGVEALNKFAEQFVGHQTIHAEIHGDLNLSNILVSENLMTGIDISANKLEPIENDIAQMLNYICVNYFNMLTRFDINKPKDTWEIFNIALDSYGYPKGQRARDFFLFVFLYQMLYRWISIKKTHDLGKEETMTFFFLGKWRLYNSSAIVKSLTKVINANYL